MELFDPRSKIRREEKVLIALLGRILQKIDSLANKIKAHGMLARFKSVGSECHLEWPVKVHNPKWMTLGNGVTISWNGWLYAIEQYGDQSFTPELEIGNKSYIGNSCHIVVCNRIQIGKSVMIADRCYISDNLHEYEDVSRSIAENPMRVPGEVRIGDHSWIGENVCIYGNVTIGKHCVVGANSVVMQDLPDYSVAVGMPAQIVKRYDFSEKRWRKTNKSGDFIDDLGLQKLPRAASHASA
ncbi:MAG: acyltransferase [Microcoleus sp. T3-bin5]|nr:acyltransferase [Microcoleus sp. T3-bin5]